MTVEDREIERRLSALEGQMRTLKQHTNSALNPDHVVEYIRRDLHNLGQIPSAGVYGTGVQSVASGVGGTQLTAWNTVSWNTDQMWDSTNQWFVPRVSGIYLVTVSISVADASTVGKRGVELLANGTLNTLYSVEYDADTVNDTNLAVAGMFVLSPLADGGAGTRVLSRVVQNSGGALDVACKAFNIVRVADFTAFGTKS